MKRRWANLLRILVSGGALAFVVWRVDIQQTALALGGVRVPLLSLAFILYGLSLFVRAFRWLLLLRPLAPGVSYRRLVRLYFVGQFFNSFLPSSFGGDFVRALELTQDTDSAAAIGTVFLDRMTGLMTLSAMGLLVLPFQAGGMPGWLVWLTVGVTGGILISGALILEGRLLRAMTASLGFGLSLVGHGPIAKVYSAITSCGWKAIWGAFAVSVVFNVMNVLINWLCGEALLSGIALGFVFVVTPILSVSGLIPSIGGWGVRETVSTVLFGPAGPGEDIAAALGVSLGLVTLATGVVGGIVYGMEGLLGLRGRGQSTGRPVTTGGHHRQESDDLGA
jgi:uncharacterized membrane protein YbhN (UPF0104 family)